jgi:hypothetical protein
MEERERKERKEERKEGRERHCLDVEREIGSHSNFSATSTVFARNLVCTQPHRLCVLNVDLR